MNQPHVPLNPLVSIIIPMYNTVAKMDACLQSLFVQAYTPIELIFVDDSSTDNTVTFVTDYLRVHTKKGIQTTCICHPKNMGVAAARNTGLNHATGDYIYYVDADDSIADDTIAKLVEAAKKTDADIVGCEWYLSYKQNERHMHQPPVTTPQEAFEKMTSGVLRWNLWLYLVKRSLYERHQLRFLSGMNMGEDMLIMGELFLLAHRITMIHTPFYHYTQTNEASLTKDYSPQHADQVTANMTALTDFVRKLGQEQQWGKHLHYLKLNIKLPLLVTGNRANIRQWSRWFVDSNRYICSNKALPWRTRALQWCASKKLYTLVQVYYHLVIRLRYGLIYK